MSNLKDPPDPDLYELVAIECITLALTGDEIPRFIDPHRNRPQTHNPKRPRK